MLENERGSSTPGGIKSLISYSTGIKSLRNFNSLRTLNILDPVRGNPSSKDASTVRLNDELNNPNFDIIQHDSLGVGTLVSAVNSKNGMTLTSNMFTVNSDSIVLHTNKLRPIFSGNGDNIIITTTNAVWTIVANKGSVAMQQSSYIRNDLTPQTIN